MKTTGERYQAVRRMNTVSPENPIIAENTRGTKGHALLRRGYKCNFAYPANPGYKNNGYSRGLTAIIKKAL